MKLCNFLVLACLMLVTGLYGEFSITQSPNGHYYHPTYSQSEEYDIGYVPSELFVGNLNSTPYISSLLCYNPGTIHFSIDRSEITFARNVYVKIDQNYVINGQYNGGGYYTFDLSLDAGEHFMTIYSSNDDWDEDLVFMTEECQLHFSVLNDNKFYYNPYARIYPITHNLSQHNAIRPALFVEGFSAEGIIEGGFKSLNGIINKWKNKLSDTKIYRLELLNPTQDVRDNAMVVLGALRFIHDVQPTDQLIEGTSVYGYSMGGILARYALAYAEHWNVPHFCTQYISLDAPHRGASLNHNLQSQLEDFQSKLSQFEYANGTLNACLSALDSQAAKQLIRTNIFASGYANYYLGSNELREFFAEINEEERQLQSSIDPLLSVLNGSAEASYEGMLKPGFPYKQNHIKCLAYSNGGLNISGNTSSEANAATCSINIEGIPFSENVAPCGFDTQPGSVFEDYSLSQNGQALLGILSYSMNITANYAPVIVPTRSSLYLKPDSITGGYSIPQLAINDFSSLLPFENALQEHTYFDRLVNAPNVPNQITEADNPNWGNIYHKYEFDKWNWRHGELGWTHYNYDNWVDANIEISDNWLDQIENRTVSYITGHVNGDDYSGIEGTMFINGMEYRQFSVNDEGDYSIPYLYTNDNSVRLVLEKLGYLPTCRNIDLNYSSIMQGNYVVTNIDMVRLNLSNVVISGSGNESFETINDAIESIVIFVSSGLYNNEPVKIRVLPGTYNESVDLSPLADLGISNFTLEGVGDAVINGDDYGIKLEVYENPSLVNAVYNINSLKVTGSVRGVVFRDHYDDTPDNVYSPHLTLNIRNCSIYDCGGLMTSASGQQDYSGCAIHFEGAGLIGGCSIYGNDLTSNSNQSSQLTQAGGIYICNNTNAIMVAKNNTISNNIAGLAGGIVVTGMGNAEIVENKLTGNEDGGFCDIDNATRSNALSVYNARNATIRNNLFIDNPSSSFANSPVVGLRTYPTQQGLPIKFVNNTIVNAPESNDADYCAIKFKTYPGVTEQDIQIQNNIVSATNSNNCSIVSENGDNHVSISNNMFHNTRLTGFSANLYNPDDQNSVYNPNAPMFNYQCDPQLDVNYIPIWNSSTMSHCIDTGTGTYDLDDDTPPDIGAYRAVDHSYWQYRFKTGQNDRSDTYHWVSYPVVNSLTDGMAGARSFFHELLGTHYSSPENEVADNLQEILWSERNQSRSIIWDGSGWGDYIDIHNVASPQGYKVKLLPQSNIGLVPTTVELHHSGFLTPDNTPFTIHGSSSNNGQTFENWIGYFDTDCSWPSDAFASIWNDITMIKAKNWCLYKDPSSGLGVLSGRMLPLNCGDMVIVTTVNDHEFQWNTSMPTDPKKKEAPTAFEFVEKADYTPVYLDLSAFDLTGLKEIGLKLDGICKGAVVVTDSLEQICAYLDESESLSSGAVELVFFYESKNQLQERKSMLINDNQLKCSTIGNDSAYPVYNVKVLPDDIGDNVTPLLGLEQNYPNPFNPSTTIRYSLNEAGSIALDIYNIKGQVVKSLYQGSAEIGNHTITWNGLDNSGKECTSGVYFYRLRTPQTTLVRKMLMLK